MSKSQKRGEMTKEDFLEGMGLIRMLRSDLPDGMWPEIEEMWVEVKRLIKAEKPIDWEEEADLIDDICHEWGFPSVFGKKEQQP